MLRRPLWADLHNHNAIGYGAGSLERSYAIARGALLDAFCFTPHGRWHDAPATDTRMAEFHRAGYDRVRENWQRIKAAAEANNQPGKFVAFAGFEWHSSRFGDSHLIFSGLGGELFDGETLTDFQQFARENNAILIPHHVGYAPGWRGAAWDELAEDVSPVVEVFSEHGCSMEPEFGLAMLGHSMGGADRQQAAIEQLRAGKRFGLVASTDNHAGHPASYGEGLTGIWADALSRDAVFDAVRRRRTYAVTGDRIDVDFRLGHALMGERLSPHGPADFSFDVRGCGAIDYVRILKNGRVAHSAPTPPGDARSDTQFVVRIEFGWDAMTSRELTRWNIAAAVCDGELISVGPCFSGGASSELVNVVRSVSNREVTFESFTSRSNSRPTNSVVLRVVGGLGTRIVLGIEAEHGGVSRARELSASVGELLAGDQWTAISEMFSSPKLRLGQARGESEVRVTGQWRDASPRPGDWYFLKVLQANGHAAWTSPIWIG